MEILLSPSLALAFVLATLYASLFHLWKGKGGKELLLYWAASLIGFGLGHKLGTWRGYSFFTVGSLHIIEGSAGSLLCMAFAKWLKV